MLVDKTVVGDDLKCSLAKTSAKATIKSAETQATKWGFGDARCSVQLSIGPGRAHRRRHATRIQAENGAAHG